MRERWSTSVVPLSCRCAPLRPFDTFNLNRGLSPEVPGNQPGVRKRVDRKTQAMTIQAYGSDHLLVRSQIVILVVIGHDLTATFDFDHMTGRTAYATARRRLTGQLGLPQPVVDAFEVGPGVGVIVAGCTGLNRGPLDVHRMGPVTGSAIERSVYGVGPHRQTRLGDGHQSRRDWVREPGRDSLRQDAAETKRCEPAARVSGRRNQRVSPHAVPPSRERSRLHLVAAFANPHIWRVDPASLYLGARSALRDIRRVATGAVHSPCRVSRGGPLVQRRLVGERNLGSCRVVPSDRRLLGQLPRSVTRSQPVHRGRRDPGLSGAPDQEIFIKRTIVMVVMTAPRRACVEGEIRMARPSLPHVLIALGMTSHTEIHRDGDRPCARDLWTVLHVTGRAATCIESFPINGHSRTAKLLA